MNFDHPLTVQLDEIPKTGRTFEFDKENKNLQSVLQDLIGSNKLNVKLSITPHVDAHCYSIEGTISTALDLACSRCAVDFKFPVTEKVNELLLVKDEAHRNEHYASGGQVTPTELDGLYCSLLTNEEFDLAEFIHEIIAAAEPYSVTAVKDCDDTCENFQKALKKGWISSENAEFSEENRPFESLKGLKLNS